MTNDGQPYGPIRYRQLVKECYSICTRSKFSYEEVLNMSPKERELIIEFINEDNAKAQEMMEQAKYKK